MSIRKGDGAWGAGAASDEPRYRAPSLGPAWSIRVIAAAVAAEEREAAAEADIAEEAVAGGTATEEAATEAP